MKAHEDELNLDDDDYFDYDFLLKSADGKPNLLKMVDAVSLYPSVMRDKPYPCGNYEIVEIIVDEDQIELAEKISKYVRNGSKTFTGYTVDETTGEYKAQYEPIDGYKTFKQKMYKSCYLVDMDARPGMCKKINNS